MSAPARIVYRLATVDDVPALAELRAAFTFEGNVAARVPSEYPSAFDRVVRPGIESERWSVWLAEGDDGSILAHACVGLIERIPRPVREPRYIGYLTNVYTRPEHRNRGIGADLLANVIDWARAEDVEVLVVWPSDESVAFYERAGFKSERDPLVWYA